MSSVSTNSRPDRRDEPDPTGPPLAGVRVLDMSRVFAGPVAGRTLSDLGADVVKVEPPDGDVTRRWGRSTAGLSTYFTQQNCGKRNVSIDLNSDGGPELAALLAERADVLIENFRPGVMKRFGLDYATLAARNPRLVMLSISGFGQEGPESQRAAYAPIIHAETGLVPTHDENVEPRDLPTSAADVLSGMHGVIGVLAALRARDATGKGQHVDLAMIDAMTFSNDNVVDSLDGRRRTEHIGGEVWNTASGPIMLTGGLRWIWHQLSNTAGLVDPVGTDAPLEDKLASRRRVITEFLCSLPDRAAVKGALDAANLAWADIRTERAVFDSPTLQARGTVVEIDDRDGGTREVVRNPYHLSSSDTSNVGVAAHRGEHNLEVLIEWAGLDDADVDRLTQSGVLSSDEWAARP